MENRIRLWLTNIKRSVVEIYEFLPAEKNLIAFQKDLKTRKAVERNIEIIGEAINRILKVYPDIPITQARHIVTTRHRIMHACDLVAEDVIWAIVTNDLPDLEQEVDLLLR